MSGLGHMLRNARRAVLRRGTDVQDADDLVQEAFVRVEQYERRHAARSQEAMLVSTAVNLSIDGARRRARLAFVQPGDELLQIADTAPLPDEVMRSNERLRHAAQGLEQLSEQSRRILLSRRLDNLSYGEIAEREGLSVAAVEKRVARATLELMKWMDGW